MCEFCGSTGVQQVGGARIAHPAVSTMVRKCRRDRRVIHIAQDGIADGQGLVADALRSEGEG